MLYIWQVVYLEAQGDSAVFSSLQNGPHPLYVPMIMLVIDCVLYLLLAIYLDQVLPGKVSHTHKYTPQRLPFTLELLLGCIVLMLLWYSHRRVWNEEVLGVLPEAVLLVQKQETLCGSQFSVRPGGAQHSQGGRVCGAGFFRVQRKRSYLVKVQNRISAYVQKWSDVQWSLIYCGCYVLKTPHNERNL